MIIISLHHKQMKIPFYKKTFTTFSSVVKIFPFVNLKIFSDQDIYHLR